MYLRNESVAQLNEVVFLRLRVEHRTRKSYLRPLHRWQLRCIFDGRNTFLRLNPIWIRPCSFCCNSFYRHQVLLNNNLLDLLNGWRMHCQGGLAINGVLLAAWTWLCDRCKLRIALVDVAHQVEFLLLFSGRNLDAVLLNDSLSWAHSGLTLVLHLYDWWYLDLFNMQVLIRLSVRFQNLLAPESARNVTLRETVLIILTRLGIHR